MHLRQAIRDGTFSVREISEKAAEHPDPVRFDIGQPDVDTPPVAKEAAADILAEDHVTYTSLWGIPPLREAAAAYESGKMDIGPENVMVTTGGIGGLFCILTAILEPGQSAVANDPAWMPYSLIARGSPGTLRQVPYFDGAGNVRADAVRDAIDDDTELLIINSPENPTGRVYTEAQIEELGAIAAEHDLYIIADEVYDHLLYEGAEHASVAEQFPERTLLVNSVSKNFAMTGWRIGWVAAQDPELIHELGKVNRATTACPNYLGQHAAVVALRQAGDYTAELRELFAARRERTLEHLDELGWDAVPPDGAMYVFPDVEQDSWTFANELLAETGVAVVPGAAAGSASDTNVRICFGSVTVEDIDEGFERIKAFV